MANRYASLYQDQLRQEAASSQEKGATARLTDQTAARNIQITSDNTDPTQHREPRSTIMAKAATKKTPDTKPAKTKAEKPKVEKVEKPKQPSQNGITHPKAGTTVGRVWEIADSLSKLHLKNPQIATRADVLTAAENEKINGATAATQYGRWRRYHGIKGRSEVTSAE